MQLNTNIIIIIIIIIIIFLDLLHFTAEDTQPGIFPMESELFLMLCLYRDKSSKFKVLMPFSTMITVLMPLQLGALTQTTVTNIWHKIIFRVCKSVHHHTFN